MLKWRSRAKDARRCDQLHSYAYSSDGAATQFLVHNKRVLTRFTCGLLRAPTHNRPLFRWGSGSILANVSSWHFHRVLVGARTAPWGSHNNLPIIALLNSSAYSQFTKTTHRL